MQRIYGFPKGELLRYRQIATPESGREYLLAIGTLENRTGLRYKDYALRAKACRDGLEGILLEEEPVKQLRSDKSLRFCFNQEDGGVTLFSASAKKYLCLTERGATLSAKKQLLQITENGTTKKLSARIGKTTMYLRCVARDDTPYGYVFTSATADNSTSLVFLERWHGLGETTEKAPLMTAGSVSDIHIDYNVQGKAPYLRNSVFRAAKAYRTRYDLDCLLTCGDNISDNASHPIYTRGVLQGKFPRKKFLSTQNLLQNALKRSFRNPENAKNIFWISGNHDCQVGDRQPEGKRFNSNDYTHLLPEDIQHPLFKDAPMDVGVQKELLCYEYRVKNIPILVLNTPLYPFAPTNPNVPDPHRPAPGHTLEQAQWLEGRLKELETELGANAVYFVLSHYPFHRGCFISYNKCCPHNTDAYLLLDKTLNRYPNLFWFYGHVHGTDHWITHTRSAECMQTHTTVEMSLTPDGSVIGPDSPDRGNLRSELVVATGFKSVFVGSLAYFETSYFKNDGKRIRSGLTDLEVPFSQGIAVQVYDDRVVLTMENFGTRAGTALIQGGKYKIKPMVYPILK